MYPIKVNQHLGVAGELASQRGEGFGLEAGSKPELMAVLALARPGSLVVCNGYKDREYIRLALIGRKLGLQTFIVVEKPSELALVIEEAAALGVKPGLGVRMRLASLGAGKWQNSGGDKAKFGLSPRQVLDLSKQLRDAGMLDCLQLLHFHMGSQISNVRDIANGMREATRYFVELSQAGRDDPLHGRRRRPGHRLRRHALAQLLLDQLRPGPVRQHASCSRWPRPAPSTACRRRASSPNAGRAMTAHHAVLVANVSRSRATRRKAACPTAHDDEPAVIRHLREIHDELDARPPLELFHEAQHHHSRRPVAVRARPDRPGAPRAHRRPVLRHRARACARA